MFVVPSSAFTGKVHKNRIGRRRIVGDDGERTLDRMFSHTLSSCLFDLSLVQSLTHGDLISAGAGIRLGTDRGNTGRQTHKNKLTIL